eukprot:m.130341 g.130341  ORF g.130341 m.130341 type:complete len:490 (-) comp11281_c0_seq2:303-1772(-)
MRLSTTSMFVTTIFTLAVVEFATAASVHGLDTPFHSRMRRKHSKTAKTAPAPPPGPTVCGCGDGTNDVLDRPAAIEFKIKTGSPIGLTIQSNKGGSLGDTIGTDCGTASVTCYNNKDNGEIFLAPTAVALDGTVVVNPDGNSEMECEVTCSGTQDKQTIDVHTSCSQDLFVGQNFGAMEVVGFPNTVCDPNYVPPPCGCDEGTPDNIDKPDTILFTVNAGAPIGLTIQGNKGGSTGSTITTGGCTSLSVRCYNNKNTGEIFLPTTTVAFGGEVTTQPNGNSEMECQVTCGTQVQTIDIHTSCSQTLFLGQNFGAMTISGFPQYASVCAPSSPPVFAPTARPTDSPTRRDTGAPTARPTGAPSRRVTGSPTARPTGAPAAELPRCCIGNDEWCSPYGLCGAYAPGNINYNYCGDDRHADQGQFSGCTEGQVSFGPSSCTDPNTAIIACTACSECAGQVNSVTQCSLKGGVRGCVDANDRTNPTNCEFDRD